MYVGGLDKDERPYIGRVFWSNVLKVSRHFTYCSFFRGRLHYASLPQHTYMHHTLPKERGSYAGTRSLSIHPAMVSSPM